MPTHPPLIVVLEGRPIGRIERTGSGQLTLHYDDAYREDPAATPLSVSMPRTVPTHTTAAILPWLWGLLPDNDRVLDRWSRQFQVSASSPHSLLSTPVGHDCAGAVQFALPDDVDELLRRPGERAPLDSNDLEARLTALRQDSTAWLGPGFTGQFSLAGAQAKLALHHDGTGWGEPTGSLPTTHILKPAMAGLEAQELNEHLCLAAARELGLPAAAIRVEHFGAETAIVVERYDRITVDGQLLRVHQEDLCQASGHPPAAKYQSEGGPSPSDLADMLRSSIPGVAGVTAVERLADGIIFNWLIGGTDAHAKNYALRLAGPQIRFAPLYDIASMLPYDTTDGRKIKLAMKVGGEYRLPRINRRSVWVRFAGEVGLPADAVIDRARDLAGRVGDAFASVAADPDVCALESLLPARLVDLVAAHADRCRASLDAP